MAKDKTLGQAIDELMKNYKKSMLKAAQYASEQTTEDIYERALKCLEEYYYSYTELTHDPKSYERTYRLKDSFVPFTRYSLVDGGNSIKCSMGVQYDYNRISGYYNGSNKYQPTDSSWIIDNYLDGIHPTTNGARVPSEVEDIEVKDYYSPSAKMNGHLSICEKKFENYMMISFFDQILKM